MMKKAIFSLLITLACLTAAVAQSFTEKSPATDKNKTTTTGFMQEITEKRTRKGPARNGEEVYQHRCKGCHARNTQGAPMPDDTFEWAQRLKKGMVVLKKHSLDGYNNYLMPPKGGCRDCSEDEVYAALIYMIEKSGNKIALDSKNK